MKELFLHYNSTYQDVEDYIEHFSDFIKESHNKHLILSTGQLGLMIFNNIIQETLSTRITKSDNTIIPSDSDSKEQFITYSISGDVKVTLVHDTELDSFSEKEMDPVTGYPIKSSTIYFKEIK